MGCRNDYLIFFHFDIYYIKKKTADGLNIDGRKQLENSGSCIEISTQQINILAGLNTSIKSLQEKYC
jgi:hypothetical protein